MGISITFYGYWLFRLQLYSIRRYCACIRRCVMVSLAVERQEKSILVADLAVWKIEESCYRIILIFKIHGRTLRNLVKYDVILVV